MLAQTDSIQIDNEQIVELIEEYQASSNKSVKQNISSLIYLSLMPLAKNIVLSFARRATDPIEDLIQVASVGILKAINNYDIKKGASVKTYATAVIVGEIRHYLRDKMSLVKVSRYTKELSYRISKIVDDLTVKYGRTPTNEEIANVLKIPEDRVVETMDIERRVTPISIEQILSEKDVTEEYLPDKEAIRQYEEYISNKDYAIIVNDALEELDDESRKIIELSFFKGYTQIQISKEFNINPMSVSRKLKKALGLLLNKIKAKGVNI